MGDDERNGGALQAKGWSGECQRSVAAVAEKTSDECSEADDGSDGVQDATADEEARTQEPLGSRIYPRKLQGTTGGRRRGGATKALVRDGDGEGVGRRSCGAKKAHAQLNYSL
eukprot:gene14077-biopygen11296